MQTLENLRDTLLVEAWFDQHSETVGPLIARHGRIQRYRRGEVIYQSGDPPSGIFLVLEGAVRLYHYSLDGTEALVALHAKGRWFGELSEVDGLERTHTAIAWKPAQVLVLSSEKLRLVLDAAPQFAGFLTQLLAVHLRAALNIIIDRRELPLHGQVARILTEGSIGGRAERRQAMTQGDLAAMVGVSRQTISKILHGLRDQRYIRLNYGEIEVLDAPALLKLAAS